MVPA
jgi:hypothetical protein